MKHKVSLSQKDPIYCIDCVPSLDAKHVTNSRYYVWLISFECSSEKESKTVHAIFGDVFFNEYTRSFYHIYDDGIQYVVEAPSRKRLTTFVIELLNHLGKAIYEAKKRGSSISPSVKDLKEHGEDSPLGLTIAPSRSKFEEICNDQESDENVYTGKDIAMLDDKSKRFDWQNKLLQTFYNEGIEEFTEADDRTVIWIHDRKGLSGKSKFVKWLCVNRPKEVCKISFGTSSQIRSAVIGAGPRKVYFVDIPRTRGKDDNLENIITIIEDTKGGHLTTNFYGKLKSLIMDPPHIIIFSNDPCPKHMMSEDRWITFTIENNILK